MESIQKQDMDRHQVTFGEIDQKDVQKVCIHTPDLLDHLRTVETNEGFSQYFECCCGKKVIEHYPLSKREIL